MIGLLYLNRKRQISISDFNKISGFTSSEKVSCAANPNNFQTK